MRAKRPGRIASPLLLLLLLIDASAARAQTNTGEIARSGSIGRSSFASLVCG